MECCLLRWARECAFEYVLHPGMRIRMRASLSLEGRGSTHSNIHLSGNGSIKGAYLHNAHLTETEKGYLLFTVRQ
jgi:hypothetical protein